MILAIRHIGLSGFRQGECAALEAEADTWVQAGQLGVDPVSTRRLKARPCQTHGPPASPPGTADFPSLCGRFSSPGALPLPQLS